MVAMVAVALLLALMVCLAVFVRPAGEFGRTALVLLIGALAAGLGLNLSLFGVLRGVTEVVPTLLFLGLGAWVSVRRVHRT